MAEGDAGTVCGWVGGVCWGGGGQCVRCVESVGVDNVCVRGVHVCGECGGGQCVCVCGGGLELTMMVKVELVELHSSD